MNVFVRSLTLLLLFIPGEPVMCAEPPDLKTVPADLITPPMIIGVPAPGKRVKQVHADYRGTDVYHALYLPVNWKPGKKYPVIVEYAGNKYTSRYGDVSPGTVEGSNLGYGISGGKGFIWICMPYVDAVNMKNQVTWWGDVEATVAYCTMTVRRICSDFGGDPAAIILTGFSRGALACNYLGLHDDDIAAIWLAFIPYSHYDGVLEWDYPESDRSSALERLKRLRGRPVFVCQEVTVEPTRSYLETTGMDSSFAFLPIHFRNHNDAWTLRDIPERRTLRAWLRDVLMRANTGQEIFPETEEQ